MDGFEAFEHLFIGQDPLAIARHVRVLETIDFHAGRYWPLEAALWDIAGQVAGLPVATLFGGATDGIPAYASCGMLLPPAARAESALRLREEGFRALKIRVDPRRLEEGLAAVAATRARGRRLDGDHGRPQPGLADGRRHDARRSIRSPRARSPSGSPSSTSCGSRSRSPAPTCAGLAALRASAPGIRIAGGEMTRTFAELLAALDADAFDVHQPDVVLAAGMLRTRTIAELALARNRWFTPHTWTNGIGLLANLHVAAGVGGGPFLEFPYDPPGWTPERRDFMLAEPIRPGRDGVLRVPTTPGPRGRPRRGRAQAVRGMTHRGARARPRDDWLARAAAIAPRTELFIDGRFVPAASGRTFDDIAGRDGSTIAQVAEGGAEDVDRAVAAARALVRRPPLGRPAAGGPQAGPAPARRAGPREPRRARPARVARRRQADPRHARGRRPERRHDDPVVRRDDRQGLRRGRPDRARTRCRS